MSDAEKANEKLDVDALIDEHYDTLKDIARAKRRRARAGMTMLTTDLLHESWMKLRNQTSWKDESHFINTAALAMRHVLVNYVRAKMADKRHAANGELREDLDDILPEFREGPEEIVTISDLLDKLALENERIARVTILRYFAGFTEEETAKALGVTSRTVRRDWTLARAWLGEQMLTEG